jgi:hypothetical protein
VTTIDLAGDGVRRLIVTGHPNHELAILGFVQRVRPDFLFLTDGGGEERMSESREVLRTLGLLGGARFLAWPEERLYRGLLDTDFTFFSGLVREIGREMERRVPVQVLCESVEFYNPLHDVTLALVRAAARGRDGVAIVEFPLIAQTSEEPERYRVQRPASGEEGDYTRLRVTERELSFKLEAGARSYPTLRMQLGPLLDTLRPEDVAEEWFAPFRRWPPAPSAGALPRYERRGRLLFEQGQVKQTITYRDHFLPLLRALES